MDDENIINRVANASGHVKEAVKSLTSVLSAVNKNALPSRKVDKYLEDFRSNLEELSGLVNKLAEAREHIDLYKALFDAIRSRDWALLSDLLARGADPNKGEQKSDKGRFATHITPLVYAATFGHVRACQLLLEAGANAATLSDYTFPVVEAVANGSRQIVRLLLEHGADPNSHYKYSWPPLHKAVHNKDYNMCKLLLQYGADVHFSPVISVNSYFQAKYTPLGVLALLHDTNSEVARIYKLLRNHGAKVLYKSASGDPVYSSPLYYAIEKGRIHLSKLMLDDCIGSAAWQDHKFGGSLLFTAAQQGNADICKFLLEQGADPCYRVGDDRLHRLFSRQPGGAASEFGDDVYRTPLHAAVKVGSIASCRVLIEHGANIHYKCGENGISSLQLAAEMGRRDICDMMLRSGGPVSDVLRADVEAWLRRADEESRDNIKQ